MWTWQRSLDQWNEAWSLLQFVSLIRIEPLQVPSLLSSCADHRRASQARRLLHLFFFSACSSSASENVYSMIQHPRDIVRQESAVPGANGTMSSPRPAQGAPVLGIRAASPPCLVQRQVEHVKTNFQPWVWAAVCPPDMLQWAQGQSVMFNPHARQEQLQRHRPTAT